MSTLSTRFFEGVGTKTKARKRQPVEHPNRIQVAEEHPDILFCDGFDDAIIGVATRCGMEPVAAYDYAKVIAAIMKGGCTAEEAVEHFEFNIIGGWIGEKTPVFIQLIDSKLSSLIT